jgi:hypothetical protein
MPRNRRTKCHQIRYRDPSPQLSTKPGQAQLACTEWWPPGTLQGYPKTWCRPFSNRTDRDTAETLEELFGKERQHIEQLGTFTKTGRGYNMTLGGDGVFGFEFSEETRPAMAAAHIARFADPAERERQRQRQQKFWTEAKRTEHSYKIALTHARNPEQAKQHAEFTAQNCDPEEMRARSRLFWDKPGANESFRRQKADYWSKPANHEKRSREIKQLGVGAKMAYL